MRQRPKVASSLDGDGSGSNQDNRNEEKDKSLKNKGVVLVAIRSSYSILGLLALMIYGAWSVYYYQFESLPSPASLEQVGKRGFSEYEAMKHVKVLTQFGPHPVGSHALEGALQYVQNVAENIKKSAHWEVIVDVDFYHSKYGANNMDGGLFEGRTLVYADLDHVVLRIIPKYASGAAENAILVSSHIDTVFSTEGAGDCSSCIAVMLELARAVSQWAHGFKNAIVFLFNTGEEEGLNGAHSFITQHPWNDTIRVAIDLEAMGIGGKSGIFQTGPDTWAVEKFASVAKYPSAQIFSQDLFASGVIKSATDFQVYREVAGLSGLDFAFTDYTAIYHTKNDKLKLLKPGSLQHLGENMLSFLLHAASSSLPEGKTSNSDTGSLGKNAIYFDILGTYMITVPQNLANIFYKSVIGQSLLLWVTSIYKGGYPAAVALALSFLSVLVTLICSISFSCVFAFMLYFMSTSAVPYVSYPLLVVGLFGPPAFLGALTGQHVVYRALVSYLSRTFVGRKRSLPTSLQTTVAKLDAERWLFKAGFLQWLLLLAIGAYYQIGVSYIALVWLVSPAFAYGLLEATLSPDRLPKALKTVTLIIGLFVPFLLSSGVVIRLSATIVGYAVRLVRNPGSTPDWAMNLIVAVFVSMVVCLMLWHLLCYVHISDKKLLVVIAASSLFLLSLAAVLGGFAPPFTEDTARAVNVVHVVDATGTSPDPVSYISMFSGTPGNLIKEADHVGEGFVCGRDRYIDFVTFSANYSCWTTKNAEMGWLKLDIPVIHLQKHSETDSPETLITIDTKASTRWSLAINTIEIEDFKMKDAESTDELIPYGKKSSIDGWHIIQFSGGKKSPTKFILSVVFRTGNTTEKRKSDQLLRLRTDVNRLTPPVDTIIAKLPRWCSPSVSQLLHSHLHS